MNLKESDLLEKWFSDASFVNWAKKTDQADVQKWETYFEAHPTHREIGESGRFALLNLALKPRLVETERSQIALKRLKTTLKEKKSPSHTKTKVVPFYKKWQSAAAVLLVAGLAFWGYTQLSNTPDTILVSTTFGETQHITLADNSKVVLNANSTLSYNKNQPRKVWLKGEAFFEVAKKVSTHENFQVYADDLTVEVLGTVFNVKNRNDQTQVFLEEGKVVLATTEKTPNVEMIPGELVRYSKKQQKIIEKRQAKAIDNTSWKDGVLRFTDTPLKEALAEISDIYGIQFKLNGLKNEQLYSGGVPLDNQAIMLKALEEVYQLKIEKRGEFYEVQNQE